MANFGVMAGPRHGWSSAGAERRPPAEADVDAPDLLSRGQAQGRPRAELAGRGRQVLGLAVALTLLAALVAVATGVGGTPSDRALVSTQGEAADELTTGADVPPTTAGLPGAPVSETEAPSSAPPPAPDRPAEPRAQAPRASAATSASGLGPAAPGTAVFAHEPGRDRWEATSNGIRIAVAVSNPSPRTGEPVTFRLEASAGDRPCCGLAVVFGDGGRFDHQTSRTCPGGGPTGAGTVTVETAHTYNKAGRWSFELTVATGNCEVESTYGGLRASLEARPGSRSSQGPSQPTIRVAEYRDPSNPPPPDVVQPHAQGRDEDGYIARFLVDYGDGTTETFPGDRMGCRPSASGWPAPSMASTPASPPPMHRYGEPGTYTVTITVYSTGCDGADEQSAADTFTFTSS